MVAKKPKSELVGPGQSTRSTYDWPSIKKHYVQGVPAPRDAPETTLWPSLDETAAHFGVKPQRVREKSAVEGWVDQRNGWRAQVEATQRQARAAALARTSQQLESSALDGAKLGLQLVYAKLTKIATAANAERNGEVGAGAAIDAQELQRLGQAADLWQKVGLKALGDPEMHRVEITGPNGAPLNLAQELQRDNPERISGVLAVLREAGLGDLFGPDDASRAVVRNGGADGGAAALEARE